MAKQMMVKYVDDLDGTPADETVNFGLDGAHFEIDLCDTNAEALRSVLAPWIAKSRKAAGVKKRVRRLTGTPTTTNYGSEQRKAIRAWAVANGWAVSERGKIAESVVAAYNAAHNTNGGEPVDAVADALTHARTVALSS